MIRCSTISLKTANSGKKNVLLEFLTEYQKGIQLVIDYIWENGHSYKEQIFNAHSEQLDLALYCNYKIFDYKGKLSSRAFCSAMEQGLGIIRSAVQKRNQLLWVLNKLRSEGKSGTYIEGQLLKYPLVKPTVKELKADLSSKCIEFEYPKDTRHDMFVKLRCTGFKAIYLPISLSPKFKRKSKQGWKTKGGVTLYPDRIEIRQEKTAPPKKKRGKTIGVDTGILTAVSMSDGQSSQSDTHGHTLGSISKKMARQKKGSKAFERSISHRKNYINWSINQLNLKGIQVLNLESVNTFNGGGRSRLQSHFAHSLIESKLTDFAEENGVRIELQSPVYKSQRCSCCGLVLRKNRKGKLYSCKHCGLELDSDFNAAENNALALPKIPAHVRRQQLNRKEGFFWKPEGLFDLSGQELRVPDE